MDSGFSPLYFMAESILVMFIFDERANRIDATAGMQKGR